MNRQGITALAAAALLLLSTVAIVAVGPALSEGDESPSVNIVRPNDDNHDMAVFTVDDPDFPNETVEAGVMLDGSHVGTVTHNHGGTTGTVQLPNMTNGTHTVEVIAKDTDDNIATESAEFRVGPAPTTTTAQPTTTNPTTSAPTTTMVEPTTTMTATPTTTATTTAERDWDPQPDFEVVGELVADRKVTLDAEDSWYHDGDLTEYHWDIDGDGDYELQGETVSWTFEEVGAHAVTLHVGADDGESATETDVLSVTETISTTSTTTTSTPEPTTTTTPTTTSTATPTTTTTAEPTPEPTTTAPEPEPEETTAASNSDLPRDYSLQQLEESGEQREEDMPSLRVLGRFTALWALDYKVGVLDSYGNDDSKQWLEPNSEINRNKIQIKGNFPYDGATREWNATVVYYEQDTRTVQEGNETKSVPYANISGIDHQTLKFEPGFQSTDDLTLRPHYESSKRVAIFLKDGGRTVAKWGPYNHKSVETTAGLPFGTWGGFLPWQIQFFLLPVGLGGAIAVGGGYSFAKKTGGFGKGIAWWALLTSIAVGAALMIYFAEIVSLVVVIPPLLALPVIFGLFIVTVELVQPAIRARLEKAQITETESAVGDGRPHIEGEKADDVFLFERDEGLAFIQHGSIRSALARLFASSDEDEDGQVRSVGGMGIVPWDEIKKRYKNSGDTPDEEKFYIEDYEFEPAHWSYDFPSLKAHVETKDGGYVERWRTGLVAGGLVSIALGFFVGQGLFNAPALGAAAGLLPVFGSGIQANPGRINIEFASGADISAKAARITETQERMKYDALDKAIEGIVAAQEDVGREILKITQKTQQEQDSVIDTLHEMADSGQLAKDLSSNGDGSGEVTGDAD